MTFMKTSTTPVYTSLRHKARALSSLLPTIALVSSISLTSGCSLFRVYTIDVPQGTPISQQQAQRVQVGMSENQVLYLLGSPAFRDVIEANRWDYIYDYKAGTFGKREGKQDINNAEQHLRIYFSNRRVSRIEGLQGLPTKTQRSW